MSINENNASLINGSLQYVKKEPGHSRNALGCPGFLCKKKFKISTTTSVPQSLYPCKQVWDSGKEWYVLAEAILKKILKAAIEAFPVDKERKAVILRRILEGLSDEKQ